MNHTRDNYIKTLKHLRGFGFDPERASRNGIAQSVEDNKTPLDAAKEIVYFYGRGINGRV